MKNRFYILMMLLCLMGITGCNDDSDTDLYPVMNNGINWDKYEAPITSAEGDTITVPLVNFLADGTMIMAEADWNSKDGEMIILEVFMETAPGSHEFRTVAVIENTNNATFISPEDEDSILVGDMSKVYRVDLDGTIENSVVETSIYKAQLVDGTLYVNGGYPNSTVRSFPINDPTQERELLTVSGASAAVLVHEGKLYTAAGSGENTGLIKCIDLLDIPAGSSVALEDVGTEFFQSDSAGSLACLGDYMLVGNSKFDESYKAIDNVCNVVTLADSHEMVSFDPLSKTDSDTYTVCVSGLRTALVGTDWNVSPATTTVFVTSTARMQQTVRNVIH